MSQGQSSLRVEALSRGRVSYVRLYGTIDETFDVAEFLAVMGGGDVILNLKAVKRMSSFGIREWVNAMKQLRPRVQRVIFVECSPAVVSQLNMIANFAEGADVASVMAPYFCEKCEWDSELTLNLLGEETPQFAELVTCRRCGAAMQLDDDPEAYLAFARTAEPRRADPELEAFLRDFSATLSEPDAPRSLLARASAIGTRVQAFPWRRFLGRHRHRLIPAAALAVIAVVALVVMLVAGGDPEQAMSATSLTTYHELLSAQKFDEARALLEGLQTAGTLPAKNAETMLADIEARRDLLTENLVTEARRHYTAKRFKDAAASFQRAAELGVEDDTTMFWLAEALRRDKRLDDAFPWYERFATAVQADHPRRDDAIFWQAEYHASKGDKVAARQLFEAVINDFSRSDYRRSANRRLRALK